MPGPKHPPPDVQSGDEERRREDKELDEALEETFPASDPISPMQHDD
jgi:hypothetical protein